MQAHQLRHCLASVRPVAADAQRRERFPALAVGEDGEIFRLGAAIALHFDGDISVIELRTVQRFQRGGVFSVGVDADQGGQDDADG